MSYTVIARKYRPATFDDLIGQDPIANTLKNAILMEKIHHAYLFSGPRGVGKTSTARILAKSVNCDTGPTVSPCEQCKNCKEIPDGISMDVVEIDGASNRGIDEIRELKEKINYTPISSKYKIYIIDEVHMLTSEAFNALLKTLEEPPEHIIFMFATTEPHKIPLTVLSRTQRFDFRRITIKEISERLKNICNSEKVETDMESLFLIAKNSDGSMRDAQSALDQLIAYSEGKINTEKVRNMFGISTSDIYHNFLNYIKTKDVQKGVEFISNIYTQGLDLKLFITNFIDFLKNLFLVRNQIENELILEETKEEIEKLKKWSQYFEADVLDEMIKYLINMLENFRYSTQLKMLLELAFINLIDISNKISFKFLYNYIMNYQNNPGQSAPAIQPPVQPTTTPTPSPEPASTPTPSVSTPLAPAQPETVQNDQPPVQQNTEAAPVRQEAITETPIETEAPVQQEQAPPPPAEPEKNMPPEWKTIIDAIEKVKPMYSSSLLKGEFESIINNEIIINTTDKFVSRHLNEIRQQVEDLIKEETKKEYKINFKLIKKKVEDSGPEKADPLMDAAKRIFKGKVVEPE